MVILAFRIVLACWPGIEVLSRQVHLYFLLHLPVLTYWNLLQLVWLIGCPPD